ncbi:hypothetical protein CC79DRAFT_22356 [Sarocladium strictum]
MSARRETLPQSIEELRKAYGKRHVKRSNYEIAGRDHFLLDLPKVVIEQLTQILNIPMDLDPERLPEEWRTKQEGLIINLDSRLLKPRDLLSRAAMAVGKHKIRYFPRPAHLCDVHKKLDPRVIHNLMLMVINECTTRSDKYRRACRYRVPKHSHGILPKEVEAWIDRLDQIFMLRLSDPHQFGKLYRYKARLPPHCYMKDCEACALSVIGGNPDMLADLWAGLKFRRTAYEHHQRFKDPRLLRIIFEWVRHFDEETKAYIRSQRDKLLPHLDVARDIIVDANRRRTEAQRREGKHSKKPKHSHSHGNNERRRSRKGRDGPSSLSRRAGKAAGNRGRQADTVVHPQSSNGKPQKASSRFDTTSTATQRMVWPSAHEFEVVMNEEEIVKRSTPPVSAMSMSDDEDQSHPVSPITEDGASYELPVTPIPLEHMAMHDEYELGTSDSDDEAAAATWFARRTAYLGPVERQQLAEALPAFSTYKAMSAVPESLSPVNQNLHEEHDGADDGGSWYSATVHTYVPRQGIADEGHHPVPRPSSSHYTSLPAQSRYGVAPATHVEHPMLVPEVWRRRFVDEDTLATMEGRQ